VGYDCVLRHVQDTDGDRLATSSLSSVIQDSLEMAKAADAIHKMQDSAAVKYALKQNFKFCQVDRDGHCLENSILAAQHASGDKVLEVHVLRNAILAQFEQQSKAKQLACAEHALLTVENYKKGISAGSIYLGLDEIEWIARDLDLQIVIHHENYDWLRFEFGRESETTKPIHLAFLSSGAQQDKGHFGCLSPLNQVA